jgi:RHS repeat-associated protein
MSFCYYDTNSSACDEYAFPLKRITDTLGRTYTFAYSGGHIESLTEDDGLGRVISYGYNGDDELTTVTYPATTAFPNPNEPTIAYAYDGAGRLDTVTDARGHVILDNTYDGDGALASQQHGEGDEAGTVTLGYSGLTLLSGEDHAIRVTDAAGEVTERYFNEKNQMVRLRRLEGTNTYVTTIEWDDYSDDLPTKVTHPDGIEVVYTYAGPGSADADYKYRMNISEVTRTGAEGKALKEVFGHEPLAGGVAYWDARFGESFVTCHSVYGPDASDEDEDLLRATAYTYSSDGKATLDGIDYFGIEAYGVDPFALCPSTGGSSLVAMPEMEEAGLESGLAFAVASSLLAGDSLYTEEASELSLQSLDEGAAMMLEAFDMADMLYEIESLSYAPLEEGGEFESMSLTTGGDLHHEEFLYNTYGQMTEHKHPDNDEDGDPYDKERRKDTYGYDTLGYLNLQKIDDGGKNITTAYLNDNVGRVEVITNPMGKVTDISYDELDQVTQVLGPLLDADTDWRPTATLRYDENGNLVVQRARWFDAAGEVIPVTGETIEPDDDLATEYGYDNRNRVKAVHREYETGLVTTEYQYDGNGRVLKVLSPLAVQVEEAANVVEYAYNERGLLRQVTRGQHIATSYEHNAAGRVVRQIEGVGSAEARITEYAYDDLGYLKETRDAAGLVTTYARDALGRATREIALDGGAVLARNTYIYNVLGRLTYVVRRHLDDYGSPVQDGWKTTLLAYTDAGQLLLRSVEEEPTTFTYDTAMRLEGVRSPAGNRAVYERDNNGNVTLATERADDSTSEGENYTDYITRYDYDALDRMMSLGRDDGDGDPNDALTTTFAYDSLGQLVEEKDPLNNLTVHEHDSLGRLRETLHGSGSADEALVSYGYDANNRLTAMTDPNDNTTGYAHDSLNRLVRSTYADGQVEHFVYDALDNVVEHIGRNGLKTSITRDAAGRPVGESFTSLAGRQSPGPVSYAYDGLGRMTEACDEDSVVSRVYDTLGNAVREANEVGTHSLDLRRTMDRRGRVSEINPYGNQNTLAYARDADGKISGISRNTAPVASFGYLGARPLSRSLQFNGNTVGESTFGYERTGQRPDAILHENTTTTLDSRTYDWDDTYNLDTFEITGGSLDTDTLVDYAYDDLNRIEQSGFTLDDAGNRIGADYVQSAQDEKMHRYSEVATLGQLHDTQGALVGVEIDADTLHEYLYDANDRLAHFRDVTLADTSSFPALNLSDGNWSQPGSVSGSWGTWAVNNNGTGGDPTDDFISETTTDKIGTIFYDSPHSTGAGFSFQYRSRHDPADPDGDSNTDEPSTGDHTAKYYAQALLAVDAGGGPNYGYVALRIEPDRLGVVYYDGTTIHELDSATVESRKDAWYKVEVRYIEGAPGGTTLSIARGVASDNVSDNEALATLLQVPMEDPLPTTLGFTVGELALYDFRLGEYADGPDISERWVSWGYDALGRKVAETVYAGTDPEPVAQTLYLWDGWRLLSEVDGLTGERIAEYVPGPSYVDDLVASGRDANSDGVIRANELLYPLADQQHSTVALMDVNGAVVERYGYDAFGAPTFYNNAGTDIGSSAAGNAHLYTGRQWLPELGLYDYRQRMYDPTTGRFLTTDPAHDPTNLGNPYTYVANNPAAFVDPYGEALETPWDLFSLGLGSVSLGYNLSQGNYLSAGVDAVGVALDGFGAAVPFVPGGVGAAIQVYRGADIAYNGAQAVAGSIDAGIAVSDGDYAGAAIAGAGAALQGAHAGVRVGQVAGGVGKSPDVEVDIMASVKADREFDKARAGAYPYKEVQVNKADGSGNYRLDSYNPRAGEIVSRKFTQLSDIQEKTARAYISELPRKYPRGATIANVPSNKDLVGKRLEGQYFLEVPVQRAPIPQSVLNHAKKLDVRIRDITGNIY